MPDLYVKRKFRNTPDAPKFYFKKTHTKNIITIK